MTQPDRIEFPLTVRPLPGVPGFDVVDAGGSPWLQGFTGSVQTLDGVWQTPDRCDVAADAEGGWRVQCDGVSWSLTLQWSPRPDGMDVKVTALTGVDVQAVSPLHPTADRGLAWEPRGPEAVHAWCAPVDAVDASVVRLQGDASAFSNGPCGAMRDDRSGAVASFLGSTEAAPRIVWVSRAGVDGLSLRAWVQANDATALRPEDVPPLTLRLTPDVPDALEALASALASHRAQPLPPVDVTWRPRGDASPRTARRLLAPFGVSFEDALPTSHIGRWPDSLADEREPATWTDFEAVRDAMAHATGTSFGHGTLWHTAAATFLVRPPFTDDEARFVASWLALFSSPRHLADDVAALEPSRLELLRVTSPATTGRARPLNPIEPRCRAWHVASTLHGARFDVVGLFNEDDVPQAVRIRRCDLEFDADQHVELYDIWDSAPAGRLDQQAEWVIPPRSCRMITLRAVSDDRPTLMASSRHVADASDVASLQWDANTATLTGTVALVPEWPTTLTLSVPPSWDGGRVGERGGADARLSFSEGAGRSWFTLRLEHAAGGVRTFALQWQTADSTPTPRAPATAPHRRVTLEQVARGVQHLRVPCGANWQQEDTDLVQQCTTSVSTGTHAVVSLDDDGACPAGLPAALAPLLGSSWSVVRHAEGAFVCPVGPDDAGVVFDGDGRHGPWALAAPSGGGFVALFAPGRDAQPLLRTLADDTRCGDLVQRLADAQLERFAALDSTDRLDRGEHPRHLEPRLTVGSVASETRFAYGCRAGGGLTSERALTPSGAWLVDTGRVVRGAETFTVPLASNPPNDRVRQLVLVRRTAPSDFGKVVRVVMDDIEDLGPWHLGNGARPGRWWNDVLRISSDLLDWRETAPLSLELEEGQSISSFALRLLWEDDPDGLSLSELEPDEVDGAPLAFDRQFDGDTLRIGARAFLRGLGARGRTRVSYRLPDGYQWLDARVGIDPGSPAGSAADVRVLVDGETRFSWRDLRATDDARAVHVALPGACTLTLETITPDEASPALVNWVEGAILR